MKKILALALSALLLLASCGAPQNAETDHSNENPPAASQDSPTAPDRTASAAPEETTSPAETPRQSSPTADTKADANADTKANTKATTPPADTKPAPAPQPEPAPQAQTVTLSVQGSVQGSETLGMILPACTLTLQEGDTAFSVLSRTLREKKIQMESSGSGESVYVKGIANLYEFDEGPQSGWSYRVNGQMPSKSAGAYVLAPGDRVEWIYILQFGEG